MAALKAFDAGTAKRIASATQVIEDIASENVLDRWSRRGYVPPHAALGFAASDMRYGDDGTVYLAQGTPTNETATTDERTVYNTVRATIWSGSPCWVTPPISNSSGTGPNWHIAQAYAATQLSGICSDDTRGPGYAMLTSISAMDGYFSWPVVPVFVLPGYTLAEGMGVLADWNETAFRWETVGCCDIEDEGSLLCVACSDTETTSYDITLALIADDGCDECDDFNGTYRLTQELPYCMWSADITSTVDSCLYPYFSFPLENRLQMTITQTLDGDFTLIVDLIINHKVLANYQRIQWAYTGSTAQEVCGAISSKSIPYSKSDGSLALCDATASTCTVSAV